MCLYRPDATTGRDATPEQTLAALEPTFAASRDRLPGYYNLSLLDDPATGRFLRYYLLLTHFPELLDDAQLSPEQLFWNRYHWFSRYVKVRIALDGPDAGLEQQLAQILEYPHPPCDPDWSHLEAIDARAEEDALADIRKVRPPTS